MMTSKYFKACHRIRLPNWIERIESSNFPRFDRNVNTSGKNYDESKGVVAHNAVHRSKQYPSEFKITVVRKAYAAT
jgi:predicted acyl esterase